MESKLGAVPNTNVNSVDKGHPAAGDAVVAPEPTGNSGQPADEPVHQPRKSFLSITADIAEDKPTFDLKKVVRGRRQADNCSIRTVPRELTCFVGRLHKDVSDPMKRSFYAACNSIFADANDLDEIALLSLQEAYSLCVLMYATSALHLSAKQTTELNVCWNMVFRRIFSYNKWESV